MAHSKQAKKRIRQNDKSRMANKTKASAMRSYCRKLMAAVASGDKASAEALLPTTVKRIDKAVQVNVIHGNEAARRKRQIMRAVHGMT